MSLRAWLLESRIRYALVWTVINGVTVFGIMSLDGALPPGALLLAIPAAGVGFLLHGWVWYPRARRRAAALAPREPR